MRRNRDNSLTYQTIELDGVRYAVVPEAALQRIARRAGCEFRAAVPSTPELELDPSRLAERLKARRLRVGLSQAELARRAGIRIETLNRIERGKTNPDFSTVRKIVIAMNKAESVMEPV